MGKSSGSYRRQLKFNDTIIRDGKVVKLRKNGTVRAILGSVLDIKKNKENK